MDHLQKIANTERDTIQFTQAINRFGANGGKNLTTIYAANLSHHQLIKHNGPGAGQ